MALHRDKEFYDLVAGGLRSIGYDGPDGFQMFIEDSFAKKYNFKKLAQMGFVLSENFDIDTRWVQAEARSNVHSLAAFVDIDSDGPTKGTEGLELNTGTMPTFKHEIKLNRKIISEQLRIARELGGVTDEMMSKVVKLLFNSVDQLVGGNYNTMAYMRERIVSTGKLEINAVNNPFGVSFVADFGKSYRTKNSSTSEWYAKSGVGVVTQEANVTSGAISPLQVLKDVKHRAEQKDFAPKGHWEMSRTTWDDLTKLQYFRDMYVAYTRPDIKDAATIKAYGAMTSDDALRKFIEDRIGAPIVIIDTNFRVEKFDKAKGTNDSFIEGFEEGVLVYVPDGEIGEIQCAKPIAMATPSSRLAFLDGGRTMVRSTFNDKNMEQIIETEITGLLVPNKMRWMYYVKVKK